MKVLLVHKTKVGGVSVHVREVKRQLARSGVRVNEVTRVEGLSAKSFLESYGKMKRFFSEHGPEYDVVHAHDWSIAYPALRAGLKNLVATFHGFPTHPIARAFEDYCIKRLGKRAVVISPTMKRRYPDATYIPNGVDLKLFKPSGRRTPGLVGVAQKYNVAEIEKAVTAAGMRLIRAEGVSYEKMPAFFSKIETFVSIPPSITGFNLVWLEAMACEVPYIIGTDAGIGEVLPIHKIDGLESLGSTLQKIRNGELKPLRNQRRWIEKNGFTWQSHARQLVRLYRKI